MADAMDNLLGNVLDFVPRLIGAVVVLLAALVIALLLQRLMARFLEEIGLDSLFERTGAASPLSHLGYEHSRRTRCRCSRWRDCSHGRRRGSRTRCAPGRSSSVDAARSTPR